MSEEDEKADVHGSYVDKYDTKNSTKLETKASFEREMNPAHNLLHGIEDNPVWYLCILYAFQHFLTMVGGDLAVTMVFSEAMCVTNMLDKARIFGTVLFGNGLATILQSVVGSRLPIVQITTISFLTPTLAMMNLPEWQCPVVNDTSANVTFNMNLNSTDDSEPEAIWKSRMREVQGAVIVAGLFETFLGATGLIGFLMRYIGPITICPTITLIGLSLLNFTASTCQKFWWISLLSMCLVLLFSQYLPKVKIPLPACGKDESGSRNCRITKFPLFMAFPVILGILLSWLLCAILTWTDAVTDVEGEWGYEVRVDTSSEVMDEARWVRFPYPFQWGWPTFSIAGILGMMTGALASTVESIGDYHACAKLAGAPPPPKHAINRGIAIEGLSCVLAGMWGTGNATTSNSGNIAVIGLTKVGSRWVVVITGFIMLLFGIFSKFGAFFVSVPDPVMGGIFVVLFGTLTAVGLSNLQYVDLNSSRNLIIIGVSIFFGLVLPNWVSVNQDKIDVGVTEINQIFSILLSTHMFVGGAVAFILDNTIAGTLEERGIKKWRETVLSGNSSAVGTETYDLPLCTSKVNKARCTSYIPFCHTYGDDSSSKDQLSSEETQL